MLHDILFLLIGLGLIVIGGNAVTDGSVALAKKFHLSPMLIGLTVVAFGSSTPDFVVCFISTLKDKSQLAIGDVVGSGIFDVLMVTGVIAIISPVYIKQQARQFDIPMLFLSSLVLFLMADDRLVDHSQFDIIDRSDGLLLLMFFAFYIFYLLRDAHNKQVQATLCGDPRQPSRQVPESKPAPDPSKSVQIEQVLHSRESVLAKVKAITGIMPMWLAATYIVAGLAALVFGGNWIVDGASGIARKCGMSEAMVGLTIVGIGSGVPDLASSMIAAIKKQPGLAIGNVLGACIFNVFFILGFCATVKPLHAGAITSVDFLVLLGASLLMLILGSFSRRHYISRGAGIMFVAIYVGYIVYLVLNATGH